MDKLTRFRVFFFTSGCTNIDMQFEHDVHTSLLQTVWIQYNPNIARDCHNWSNIFFYLFYISVEFFRSKYRGKLIMIIILKNQHVFCLQNTVEKPWNIDSFQGCAVWRYFRRSLVRFSLVSKKKKKKRFFCTKRLVCINIVVPGTYVYYRLTPSLWPEQFVSIVYYYYII